MKNIFLLLSISLLFGCQPRDLPTVFNMSDGYALMKVSHMTTRDELNNISQKLKTQNIELDFSASEFFDNGKLRTLKLSVTTPDGNRGVTGADQVGLQYKYFGFLYQRSGTPAFKIGEMGLL